MKRRHGCWLLAGCLALTGCVPLLQTRPELVPPATAEADFREVGPKVTESRPPVQVTAEMVTESNAREVAQALQEELDREASVKARGARP